jgi:TatD DNase family protein
MFFDSHCHLTSDELRENFRDVLHRARVAEVTHLLNIGDTVDTSRLALQQAHEAGALGAKVRAGVGIHPQNALEFDDKSTLQTIRELAADELAVAIGEIGLDYVYDDTHEKYPGASRARQREVFETQLRLAIELDMPVVIHNREADDDIIEVVSGYPGLRGVFHCFGSSQETAQRVLDAGFHLGFTGLVTFKNAADVREVARLCPLDRLLIETDSPYLAPVPHRGKANEPSFVPLVAQTLAVERNLPLAEFARVTTHNACRLFGCE